MRIRMLVLAAAVALAAAASAEAGRVEIRLVRAHQGSGISRELRDVEDLLRAQLRFPGFELLARQRIALPNDGQTVTFPRGIEVRCEGPAERLSVIVRRGGSVLLNVFVNLRGDVPVVLGGFPDGSDRLLLILRAR